jgi:hypothetical protein
MIRIFFQLLAVRASIAVLRRYLSIGNKLSPEKWQVLSVVSAAFFVLSVGGLVETQRHHVEMQRHHPAPGASTLAPQIWHAGNLRMLPSYEGTILLLALEHRLSGSASASTVKPLMLAHNFERDRLLEAIAGVQDPRFTSKFTSQVPDLPSLLRSLRQAPTVIVQDAPENGTSFGEEASRWGTLLATLITALNQSL